MRLAFVFLVTLLFAGRAAADDESWYPTGPDCVTTAASDEARRALAAFWFEQGTAQVDTDAFSDAVRSYGCSQRIIPHHATLYNLARAAEWAGELDVALHALREYLESGHDSENYAEAANLALRVAEALERRDQPPPPPPPPPGGDDTPGAPDDDRSDQIEIGGWTMLGLAGALGAVGAVMGGMALYEHGELEDAPEGTPWTELAAREERRNGYILATGVCLGFAVASGAVAAVLLGMLDDEPEPAPVDLTPVVAPDAAGMVLTWTF